MAKILVVDDEQNIREMIQTYGTHLGHEIYLCNDGQEAYDFMLKNDVDIIVMDIMMPSINGFKAYQKISELKNIPCLFLSALNDEANIIYGFDLGAQDYVTKPFSLKELFLRINVIISRNNAINAITQRVITIKNMKINLDSMSIFINDEEIKLTNKEFSLLVFLVDNKGTIITREAIVKKIWGFEYGVDDRSLDTHIKTLRKKLNDYGKAIVTSRGMGYKFEEEKI